MKSVQHHSVNMEKIKFHDSVLMVVGCMETSCSFIAIDNRMLHMLYYCLLQIPVYIPWTPRIRTPVQV